MRMDIACPTELIRVEHADYGNGRRQAYLTFLNESPFVITAISGQLALLDGGGMLLEETRVAFSDINTPPGREFTCHLAIDDYPDFYTAMMVVEDVLFDGEEPWALHPMRLRDYTPPVLADGPDRRALIAIAGDDAVCFAARQESTWLCVCGRYNRLRWTACRRCRRDRDATIAAFSPDAVRNGYATHVEVANRKPQRVIVDGAAQRRRREAPPIQEERTRGRSSWLTRVIAIGTFLTIVGLIAFGVLRLVHRVPDYGGVSVEEVRSVSVDYLEPIGG